MPTIVDLAPGADWDEREASDLYGVSFDGHEPLRPLVDHNLDLSSWTVPVRGDDTYQVAVGPIHAGVIESGHFRFHVVGDLILHLDARLFYKHRGLERAAEGQTLAEGIAYAGRACAACGVTNTLAYAQACEQILGLRPTAEVARARTILLELERLWNHLNDIAAVCAGVGLAAGNMRFIALTEQARQLNAQLTGHRFLFGSIAVGGNHLSFNVDRRTRQTGSSFEPNPKAPGGNCSSTARSVTVCRRSESSRARTPSHSAPSDRRHARAVSPKTHEKPTTCSPTTASRPSSPDAPPVTSKHDLSSEPSKYNRRWTCSSRSSTLPSRLPHASRRENGQPIGAARVESPRGATLCIVESADGRVGRLRLRTGSYANWPVVAHAAANNLLPDFPLINKSFELCYACADR